jgi:hypothetical protein
MVMQQHRGEKRDPIGDPGGEAPRGPKRVSQVTAAFKKTDPKTLALMEEVVRRENLAKALKRVR